jgi:hypothetical protein
MCGMQMSIFFKVMLALLVFLAVSSGITKIILLSQDVDFSVLMDLLIQSLRPMVLCKLSAACC